VTKQQLDLIESQLKLKLPKFYRQFMLRFPVSLVYGLSAKNRRVDSWALTNLPSRIIKLNRSVRRRGRTFDGEPWPHGFIVIGCREKHGYYLLNSFTGRPEVLEMGEEDGKGSVVANSLAEFVQLIAEKG
jgi:hypothetical protein